MTDFCELHCFHCMNDDTSGPRRNLNAAQFATRLEEWGMASGQSQWTIKEIRMTGGEPLMNLPGVLEIARICRRLGIDTGINTNALVLDESTAQTLKDAGLKTVKVSFDAVDQATSCRMRGQNESLEKKKESICLAVALGFHVLLRLTLCTHNVDQLVDCYRIARELGVGKLQIKPLVWAGRAARSRAFLSRQQLREAFRTLAAAVEDTIAQPQILCWPPEDAYGLPNKVCGSMNKMYISTNGEVSICNYLPEDPPIGNVMREPLEDIFAKRHPEIWISPRGHTMLANCPQSEYFDPHETPCTDFSPKDSAV